VRNIFSNGEGWTGTGTATAMYFPEASECTGNGRDVNEWCPAENHCSLVIKMTYGNFDYYAGGDNTNYGRTTISWKAAEWWIKDAVGDVDVMKANHHGGVSSNSQDFLSALNPAVIAFSTWQDSQPRADVYSRCTSTSTYGGKAKLFVTNLSSTLSATYTDTKNIAGSNGHIVVRVNPGGNSYYVYMIEDGDEIGMKIKTSVGPISCK
jgi:hypothetical protein